MKRKLSIETSLHYSAMCDCAGESFLQTQGRTYVYAMTHVRTTCQCKYMVLAIQFDFWKKNAAYCIYVACLQSSF